MADVTDIAAKLSPAVRKALTEYLAEQDDDAWCQRLKYGQCSLRKCLVDSNGKLRSPGSYDGATCARFRLEQAITEEQSHG